MSSKASVTTIYLTPEQKRTLMSRAKQCRSTFSQQVREAIDRYLRQPTESTLDEQELAQFASEAGRAIDRMGAKLDEAHAAVAETLHALSSRADR